MCESMDTCANCTDYNKAYVNSMPVTLTEPQVMISGV